MNSLDVTSDLHISIQSLRERGHILLELGYYDTAENMINESFEIFAIIRNDKDEIENIKADIMHTSGNLLSHKGDFQNALNYWEESLAIKIKQGKIIDQANLQNNIAIYHFIVEEYDKALEYFFDAFTLIQPFKIKKTMTGILLNIGDTYFHAGDIDKALQYVHQSLEITDNTSLDYIKSNCYLSLIQYYLILNNLSQISLYYANLLELASTIDSAYIQLFEKYAKALILKSSNLENDKQNAKQLFQQLQELSSFDFQLLSSVVLNLVDILLDELYQFDDCEKLETLTSLMDELYEDAQAKQLFHFMIDALVLKSKVVALNNQIEDSQFLMEQALMIAEDNKFNALKEKIVSEQIKLKEKIKECHDFHNKYFTLRERMDLCNIRSYVKSELNHI
ncbi:MAG: Photosystem I assembly protein Ycf3 [Candidatus Heimdallarchaeota archaeon LC_2]|nr:MAG: Photosystem I assembly protein Ycf3 [Candidatus Heimdallarchaeota archaeon LC_2]